MVDRQSKCDFSGTQSDLPFFESIHMDFLIWFVNSGDDGLCPPSYFKIGTFCESAIDKQVSGCRGYVKNLAYFLVF